MGKKLLSFKLLSDPTKVGRDLINWYRDASLGFKSTLNGLVHAFSEFTWNPDFSTLVANLDVNIFKKIIV